MIPIDFDSNNKLPEISVPDIDRCLQTGIFEKTFSAVACVASVGNTVFHRAVYGTPTQPPPHRKVGFDVLFDLAELTKPLATGLAALRLASQNRIDLNASLVKTIPVFNKPKFGAISIDMLLDHTAGFPAKRDFAAEMNIREKNVLEMDKIGGTARSQALVKEWLAETPLAYEPGTKTVYSDLGFMALGWIVESLVGKPLDIYLAQGIYRDLGLENDLFFVRLDDKKQRERLRRRVFAATLDCPWRRRVLQGEVLDANAWIVGGVAGHSGLFGTIDAVWRLSSALLSSYAGENRAFLGGTVRRFWSRSKKVRDSTRALAWDTPPAQGASCGLRFSAASVGHLGVTGTAVWIDLASNVIGVVLTNAAHPSLDGKADRMGKMWPKVYDLIAKHGEALASANAANKTKSGGPVSTINIAGGTGLPLRNPLRKPGS